MTNELIARLDKYLHDNRTEYYSNLQAGISSSAADIFKSKFSVTLPDDFLQLYLWRNGQSHDTFSSLYDNFMFSSTEEIIETKEILDGMIGYDFENPKWWCHSWIPFLSNGGGDHLCLSLEPNGDGAAGQIITFWHDEESRPITYPNFNAWLSNIVEAMENGTSEVY